MIYISRKEKQQYGRSNFWNGQSESKLLIQIKNIHFIVMYQSSTRAPTLHQWDIPDATSLPLPQQKRKLTDVICLVVGVLFGLTLFITAIVLYNKANLSKSEYPVDSQGNVCMLNAFDNNTKYPFLFFNDLQNPQVNRFCVEDCPQQGVKTNCFGGCDISFYPNYPSNNNLGAFCLPNDENLKNQLLSNANLDQTFNKVRAIDILFIGLGISFGLSIIWMVLVYFLPKVVVWAMFILSAATLIVASILCFVGASNHFSDNKGLAIFFGILFIVLVVLLVLYLCLHRRQLQLCGCFLQIAADCLRSNLTSLVYILLFTTLTILFCILLIFQYLAFSSSGTPTLNGIYYQNSRNGFLTFLLVIEAIWGLSFFRDAFNYVISGIADQWYFHKLNMFCYPLKRFFTRNIGSVVGGSFLTGFFYLPAMAISFLAPKEDCCCCNFFDLARNDVYAYVYLTGNSYCPSSRQAQYLCRRSRICRQNESLLAIYSFFSRIVISFAAILIVYWITRDSLVDEKVPFTLLAGVFFICLYISSYFADIQAIIAEAVMLCFLTQYDLQEGWTFKQMRSCPQKLSKLIIDVQSHGGSSH